MAYLIIGIIKSLRPRQWLKNLAVYTAILFTGQLFDQNLLLLSSVAFLIFCAISSACYLVNDIVDAPRDRIHPFKKNRPIASGRVRPELAFLVAVFLLVFSLKLAHFLSFSFFMVSLIFTALQFSYTFFLKHFPILDILTIGTAYIVRILAGEVLTGFYISIWLRLCVISLSLFLAIGKRRAELTLLQSPDGSIAAKARPALGHYSEKLLDVYTAIFATSTWVTYAFYTFLERAPRNTGFLSLSTNRGFGALFSDFSPLTTERKWLMLTIPFVLFGIMRYMQLIYEKHEGESPERILTSDFPLLASVVLWAVTVVGIVYGVGRF